MQDEGTMLKIIEKEVMRACPTAKSVVAQDERAYIVDEDGGQTLLGSVQTAFLWACGARQKRVTEAVRMNKTEGCFYCDWEPVRCDCEPEKTRGDDGTPYGVVLCWEGQAWGWGHDDRTAYASGILAITATDPTAARAWQPWIGPGSRELINGIKSSPGGPHATWGNVAVTISEAERLDQWTDIWSRR